MSVGENFFVDPGVGKGNELLVRILAEASNKEVLKLNGPMILLAKLFHKIMTEDCDLSIKYIGENTRESIPAKLLIWEMGLLSWAMHRNIPEDAEIYVAQDMLAQAIRIWWSGRLILLTPDVYGKTPNWPENIKLPDTIMVWNSEAVAKLQIRFKDRVNLVHIPVIIPESSGKTIPEYVFKLSGSGFDVKVITEILTRLKGSGDILIDTGLDYLSLLANVTRPNQFKMLIFPSESIMVLKQMSDLGIRPNVVSLYPRGKHELENLIWAIKHDFVKTICVPYRHQRLLKMYLDKADLKYNQQYWFVDPSEIHPLSFC